MKSENLWQDCLKNVKKHVSVISREQYYIDVHFQSNSSQKSMTQNHCHISLHRENEHLNGLTKIRDAKLRILGKIVR